MADPGAEIRSEDLKILARNLKMASPEAYKAMKAALKAAVMPVAEDAALRASFSRQIPGSIRVSARGAAVKVSAGGPAAPDGAPFENRGRHGVFRHPLWGDWMKAPFKNHGKQWVDGDPRNQRAHPYLHPAADAGAAGVADALATAVTDATADVLSDGLG